MKEKMNNKRNDRMYVVRLLDVDENDPGAILAICADEETAREYAYIQAMDGHHCDISEL